MAELWQIEMLGGLRAVQPEQIVSRFRFRKVGALLAYLAFYAHRAHPREILLELLWPGEPLDAARNKLRIALSSLRRQLEPPGVPRGAILLADRISVQLNPTAITTDVARFEAALQSAAGAGRDAERGHGLAAAADLYRGPLLPGHFEAWVLPEQQRLAGLFFQAVDQLVRLLEEAGELGQALDYAGRAVAVDPLREEAQRELIRLLAAAGQPTAAREQYRQWEQLLQQELGETPSVEMRRLLAAIAALRPDNRVGAECPGAPPKRMVTGCPRTAIPPEPREEPPLHPDAASAGHLPLQFTRFFGRESELASVRELLVKAPSSPLPRPFPLVTLTGPGGSGKTRLALEAVARMSEPFHGSVWFVPLADLTDPALIVERIRDVMHLPRSPQAVPLEQVVAALARGPALLVLDNFEHLLSEGAALVHTLLERAPALHCLITSRQRLDLAGERELPLAPLPVPGVQAFTCSGVQAFGPGLIEHEHEHENEDDSNARTPERLNADRLNTLAAIPSVALFVDRAQAVRPDFQVTAANGPAVAELCRRLEGMPLALELAAARIRLLTPAQMLEQLGRRFDFLVSRRRDLPARHQSLRAALDWSYQLLAPELQQFFARLFPFRGGFILAAAEAVCAEHSNTLDFLAQLQDSSLLLAEPNGETMRYRLLETLREFAAEQLTAAERAAVAERHARYYLALAEEAEPFLGLTPQRQVWLERLEPELDNTRAVIRWCLETGAAEVGMRLAGALRRFWWWRGYLKEGREHLARLLSLPQAQARTLGRAKALLAAGQVGLARVGTLTGTEVTEESLQIFQELGDQRGVAVALRGLAGAAAGRGDYRLAVALYEQDLAICRELGDQGEIAGTLGNLGNIASHEGDQEKARRLWAAAAALRREVGIPIPVGAEAQLAIWRGELSVARSLLEASLASHRRSGIRVGMTPTLNLLAVVLLGEGDGATARAYLEESMAICRDEARDAEVAPCLETFAALMTAEGQPAHAARLFGAAEALRERLQLPLRPADRGTFEEHRAAACTRLGEEAFRAEWALGRLLSLEQAIALALEPALQD